MLSPSKYSPCNLILWPQQMHNWKHLLMPYIQNLKRLRETAPIENSQLEGFRWQPHHQARVLWANNLHILNQAIKETSTKKNQTDSRSTTFGMKRKMKIGIWNVWTLRETGKLRQAVACMRNYGLNILEMSEVRWREFGEMTTHDGATLIYSGRPQDDR